MLAGGEWRVASEGISLLNLYDSWQEEPGWCDPNLRSTLIVRRSRRRPVAWRSYPPLRRGHEFSHMSVLHRRVHSAHEAPPDELDGIQTPRPALRFPHKRAVLVHRGRKVALREPRAIPHLAQQLAKPPVRGVVNRLRASRGVRFRTLQSVSSSPDSAADPMIPNQRSVICSMQIPPSRGLTSGEQHTLYCRVCEDRARAGSSG